MCICSYAFWVARRSRINVARGSISPRRRSTVFLEHADGSGRKRVLTISSGAPSSSTRCAATSRRIQRSRTSDQVNSCIMSEDLCSRHAPRAVRTRGANERAECREQTALAVCMLEHLRRRHAPGAVRLISRLNDRCAKSYSTRSLPGRERRANGTRSVPATKRRANGTRSVPATERRANGTRRVPGTEGSYATPSF